MPTNRDLLPLWAIVSVPIFYYFALIVGALTYPGYSHASRYASELGAAAAPYPWLFNYSIMAAGAAAIIGGYGLWRALARIGGSKVWPILAGLCLALWGVAMVMGGMFPMPDERHNGFGLALAGQLTPLFVLLAIRQVEGAGAFKAFLLIVFLASAALLAVMMGVQGLVTRQNVGIWQRSYSASAIPWLAVLGLWLIGRLRRAAER